VLTVSSSSGQRPDSSARLAAVRSELNPSTDLRPLFGEIGEQDLEDIRRLLLEADALLRDGAAEISAHTGVDHHTEGLMFSAGSDRAFLDGSIDADLTSFQFELTNAEPGHELALLTWLSVPCDEQPDRAFWCTHDLRERETLPASALEAAAALVLDIRWLVAEAVRHPPRWILDQKHVRFMPKSS